MAPPALVAPAPAAQQPFLVEWTPGDLHCKGGETRAERLENPFPVALGLPAGPVRLRFALDADGRPHGIVAEPKDKDEARIYRYFSPQLDLEPALAGSRFSAGAAGRTCTIQFNPTRIPLTQTTISQRFDWLTSQEGTEFDIAQKAFFRLEGNTCNDRLRPRVIHFPPLDVIPAPDGHLGKALLQFDVDAEGVPANLTVRFSTLTPEGTAAALEAQRASRFAPKALKNCLAAAWQPPPGTIAAPAPLDPQPFILSDARCPANPNSLLHVAEVPFPEGFQRRNIEGWSIVRFDIEPDGRVVNAMAALSEPAQAFGVQAERVVDAARADASADGYTGCVTRIVFKLDDDTPEGVWNGNAPG